jgi:hypothetical protein
MPANRYPLFSRQGSCGFAVGRQMKHSAPKRVGCRGHDKPGRGKRGECLRRSLVPRPHNVTTQDLAVGDLDGNGKDDLIVDFGGAGLWVRYNNATWMKLHNASTQDLAAGGFD